MLATEKTPPNLGSWQALQENMLPSSSLLASPAVSQQALQQLRWAAETLNTNVNKNGLEFKERPCNYRDNCYISEPNIT